MEDALREAVHVNDKVGLQTAVQQKKLVIISSDGQLYARMLKKFPREKVAKKVADAGKIAVRAGGLIALATLGLSGGLLIFGGLLGLVGGNMADSYQNYTIRMDYEKRQVQFIKVKGDPRVKV